MYKNKRWIKDGATLYCKGLMTHKAEYNRSEKNTYLNIIKVILNFEQKLSFRIIFLWCHQEASLKNLIFISYLATK